MFMGKHRDCADGNIWLFTSASNVRLTNTYNLGRMLYIIQCRKTVLHAPLHLQKCDVFLLAVVRQSLKAGRRREKRS